MQNSIDNNYWDGIIKSQQSYIQDDLWRANLKLIYQELINGYGLIALKTDLYDEASSEYNILSLLSKCFKHVIGMDYSFAIAEHARQRLNNEKEVSPYAVLVSDIRNASFKDDSFDCIISNSTLDHFLCREEIITSIRELYRILKPQGELIITLDNPWNPVVRLRNALPYGMLKLIGIIPFYMGVTLSNDDLLRVLDKQGFKIKQSSFIVHCPRFLGIWIGFLVAMLGNKVANRCFIKLINSFEYLQKTPLRSLTGYFVCVKATK